MKLKASVLTLALASLTLNAFASETNKFTLVYTSNGKSVGHASYSIDPSKSGLKFHSSFDVTMDNGGVNDLQTNASMGNSRGGGGSSTDVQYSSDYKLNADGTFISGYSQSNTTQTTVTMDTSKARDSITVRENKQGTDYGSQTVTLTDPNFFMIPNYDPGALQVLITSALAHPHTDKGYLLVIPANPDLGQDNNSAGVTTIKAAGDATGTLNGKPVALKHYTISFRAGNAEVYTDEAGILMEAVVSPLRITYIREKFIFTPPTT